jgi:acetyl esterase/lipase
MPKLILLALPAIFLAIVISVGSIAPWPLRVISAFSSRQGYAATSGIPFGTAGLRLDVYTPDRVRADAPVVIFIHGGGWATGWKDEYRFVAEALTSAGMLVVVPDYRLNPAVVFPAFVQDGAEAVAWVSRNLAGHPVLLAGHSAGAHIAALLNLDEHYLAAAGVPSGAVAGMIGLSGPYDFLPLTEERYKRVFPEATRAESQPIAFVDGSEPPMLLLTGDADTTVKPGNTTRLVAAVAAKGGKATVKVYPGVGHLGTMMALARLLPYTKPPVREDILAFVRSVTGG